MRFSVAALLFALPAIVSAFPSQPYDARFHALTVRHARVAQRMANPLAERAELEVRQTTCTTQCSSTSDQSGITAYNACSATDAVCVCNALESLSSTCLSCALPAIGLSTSEFNQLCGSGATTSTCDSQCSDSQDVSANQAAGECTTSSLDDPCVCAALGEMTTTCRNCLLQASGISSTDYSEACSGNSSSSGSGTSSAAGSSPTGASGSTCNTQCSSSSDQTALNAGEQCSETDTTCECNALGELSSTCLTCVLQASGLTSSQYQQACAGGGSGGGGGGASSLSFTGAGSTATSTASAASSTSSSGGGSTGGGFTTPSCNNSCTTSADQTAIAQGNTCPSTNVACACTAFNQMDSTCRACILTANGLTQNDLNTQCAAASSQSSASTASPSSSSLPNTGGQSSGTLIGFSIGAKELMGVAAIALGAVIFV